MRWYQNILSVDTESLIKSAWLFNRLCITWVYQDGFLEDVTISMPSDHP